MNTPTTSRNPFENKFRAASIEFVSSHSRRSSLSSLGADDDDHDDDDSSFGCCSTTSSSANSQTSNPAIAILASSSPEIHALCFKTPLPIIVRDYDDTIKDHQHSSSNDKLLLPDETSTRSVSTSMETFDELAEAWLDYDHLHDPYRADLRGQSDLSEREHFPSSSHDRMITSPLDFSMKVDHSTPPARVSLCPENPKNLDSLTCSIESISLYAELSMVNEPSSSSLLASMSTTSTTTPGLPDRYNKENRLPKPGSLHRRVSCDMLPSPDQITAGAATRRRHSTPPRHPSSLSHPAIASRGVSVPTFSAPIRPRHRRNTTQILLPPK